MKRSLRLAGVAVILSAAALGVSAVLVVRDRDAAVAAYADRLRTLEAENQRLADQMRALLDEVRGLNTRLEESYAPIEVGGRLDLPIHRAFARPGDTLERFSRREGVAVPVLRALNPWLPEGEARLQDRQSLWIPKPEG